jgi:serine/threonine protein kinase
MTLEDYTNLKFIKRGGQGELYKADSADGPVCLKKMILEDNSSVDRFNREAALNIDHPNVVKVLDSWEQEDATGRQDHYIVMEWVEGQTAAEAMKAKKRFTSKELETILDEGLSGLDAAHDQGIIHRDMKPSNIMLNDKVKILDFGIMKYDGMETSTDSIALGPVWYWSPEQHNPETRDKLTPATDRYSLGLVVYDLARGEMRKRFDHAPDVDGISRLSPSLKSKLNMLLNPSPEGRYEECEIIQTESLSLTQNDAVIYTLTSAAVWGALGYILSPEAGALVIGFASAGAGAFVGSVTSVLQDHYLKKKQNALPSQRNEEAYIEHTDVDEIEFDEQDNVIVPSGEISGAANNGNLETALVAKPNGDLVSEHYTGESEAVPLTLSEGVMNGTPLYQSSTQKPDTVQYQLNVSDDYKTTGEVGNVFDLFDKHGHKGRTATLHIQEGEYVITVDEDTQGHHSWNESPGDTLRAIASDVADSGLDLEYDGKLVSRAVSLENEESLESTVLAEYEPSKLREATQVISQMGSQLTQIGSYFTGLFAGIHAAVSGIYALINLSSEQAIVAGTLAVVTGTLFGAAKLSGNYLNADLSKSELWEAADKPISELPGIVRSIYLTRKDDRETKNVLKLLKPVINDLQRARMKTPQDFFNYVSVINHSLEDKFPGNKPSHVTHAIQQEYLQKPARDVIVNYFWYNRTSMGTAMGTAMDYLVLIDEVVDIAGYDRVLDDSRYTSPIKWITNNVIHESLCHEQEAQYRKRFSQGDMTYTQIARYMQQTSPINSTWLPMEVEEDVLGLETQTTEKVYGWEYLVIAARQVGLLRPNGTRIDIDLERLDEVRHEGAYIYARSVANVLSRSSYGIRHDIDDSLEGEIAVAIEHKKLKPSYIAQNLHKNPRQW